MRITIEPNDKGTPAGQLATAELHFDDGPLAGLKLIGFTVWERRTGNGRNVTFPARTYSVNGERRSFALLRPSPLDPARTNTVGHVDNPQDRIRELILQAYAQYEADEHSRTEFIATDDGRAVYP